MARGNSLEERDLSCRNDGCLSSVLWQIPHNAPRNEAGRLPGFPAPAPAVLPHSPPNAPATPAPPAAEPSYRLPEDGSTSERDSLIEAMERTGWVQAKAARLLNLTPRQIGYALRKYDIPIKKF